MERISLFLPNYGALTGGISIPNPKITKRGADIPKPADSHLHAKHEGEPRQHDLFNPPVPDGPVQTVQEMEPPMHVRRSILCGAVSLASHGYIRDLDKWLLTPLKSCDDMNPIEMARDNWESARKWIKTLFLTAPFKRAYILFNETAAQMGMSEMLARDRELRKERSVLSGKME